MGGEAAVARQHANGRLTARVRVARLLDDGSFREVGSLAGRRDAEDRFVPNNQVVGRGRVDGRPVVVAADDFTIRGGSLDKSEFAKHVYPERFAHEFRLPLVRLVESGGGSLSGIESLGYSYVPDNPGWDDVVRNLATVPVVALALGPCGGIAAARVAASHYSVMVAKTSQVFAGGPPLVAQTGEQIDKESLGGSRVQTRNGTVTDVVGSEDEAFARAARFLSYLPQSVFETPARGETADDPQRRDDWLLGAVPRDPRKIYAMRRVIEAVVDTGSFFELGAEWGRSMITGLARLDGWPVAVMAEDCRYGGALTADAARKAEWFVDLAQTFHLPVVRLVDQPGIPIGSAAEQAGTMRHAVRALSAVHQATVPWCSVLVRRVFGVGGAAHTNAARAQFRYSWPSGRWGSLPTLGGVEAGFKARIEAAEDPEAERSRIADRLERLADPMRTAEAFGIEEMIDPRDTRPLLCEFANLAAPLRDRGPAAWGYRG
ncbi:acyl-CoA carboxylase subunit beta [Jiangella anatolica]|uniref:Methylmalonyl-CoA carboxyltransferase n=1 Tax=Jiangella anatolica TaxID=2670374 RepID=A0A2W2B8I7_9ACTN|nr:methylmalonyl-CoA carboxyltransferase [Jiangella anatolica]